VRTLRGWGHFMKPEYEQQETVADALAWAAAILSAAGVESPRLAAEVLLAHVLQWRRSLLIANAHDPLRAETRAHYEELVRRHAGSEPLQYITGEREFYGLPIRVSPAVLIPRPETEILVEKGAELARAYGGEVRFADVGTGSGCIAIALAREAPGARGWATDLSRAALDLARDNARRLGVESRIAFVRCDLLGAFPVQPLFDLILSNPPYISGPEMRELAAGVKDHEPAPALFGGESGIEVYRRLIPQAAARLLAGGRLLLEIGAGQAPEVRDLLQQHGLLPEQAAPDLQGIPRCLVARRPEN
jgi:release factor glutamine methyltransferase